MSNGLIKAMREAVDKAYVKHSVDVDRTNFFVRTLWRLKIIDEYSLHELSRSYSDFWDVDINE